MLPNIIKGSSHADHRGKLAFNNEFNATSIKRVYTIENIDVTFVRAWQGHKIEQRWFSVMSGSFEIKCIAIDNWENPSRELTCYVYILKSKDLDILHLPNGYVSSIQALEENSKLLVMSDYLLGEVVDEYRYDVNYFNCKK